MAKRLTNASVLVISDSGKSLKGLMMPHIRDERGVDARKENGSVCF